MTAWSLWHYPIIAFLMVVFGAILVAVLRFLFPIRLDITHHVDPPDDDKSDEPES